MTKLRVRVAFLLTWLLIFFNIERFHEPLNLASFVYVLAAVVAILVIVLHGEKGLRLGLLIAATVPALFALKWVFGYPIFGIALPLTVTELSALLITASLAGLIAQAIAEFEDNARQILRMHFDSHTPGLEASQAQLYREVRRARKYSRPLSLFALTASNATNPNLVARYLEEIQQRGVRKYIDARLAQVIGSCISDCDILAYRDECFYVLCPETNREATQSVMQRLADEAQRELGLTLDIGAASFPDEEVTLGGLLEKAAGAMQGKTAPRIATPQAPDALAAASTGNAEVRSS